MQRPDMVEIEMGAGVTATYPTSVSEIAFNQAIRQNFNVRLGSASLVRDYGLERETPLFEADGMTLRMHYKRYRFGSLGRRELVLAYQRVHQDFVFQEDAQDAQDDSLTLLDVRSPEEEVIGLLGLDKEYRSEELLKALTDPACLGHGLIISNWPEELRFELFNRPPGQLEETRGLDSSDLSRGYMGKRIRPLFQGRLLIAPRFGDENISTVETALVLENPLLEQIKATAFAGTYNPKAYGDVEAIIRDRRAVEEVNWLAVKVTGNGGPFNLGSFAPDQAAATFVAFAKGLVLATKNF